MVILLIALTFFCYLMFFSSILLFSQCLKLPKKKVFICIHQIIIWHQRKKKMLYSCARSRASRLLLNVFTVLFDLTDRCQINEEPALLQTRCVPMYKAAYLLANRPASNEARCGGQNCRRIHLKRRMWYCIFFAFVQPAAGATWRRLTCGCTRGGLQMCTDL